MPQPVVEKVSHFAPPRAGHREPKDGRWFPPLTGFRESSPAENGSCLPELQGHWWPGTESKGITSACSFRLPVFGLVPRWTWPRDIKQLRGRDYSRLGRGFISLGHIANGRISFQPALLRPGQDRNVVPRIRRPARIACRRGVDAADPPNAAMSSVTKRWTKNSSTEQSGTRRLVIQCAKCSTPWR